MPTTQPMATMSTSFETRLGYVRDLYALLDELAAASGGLRILASSSATLPWPQRGVYFFFEPGELRSHSGTGLRVVRVGTHALKAGAKSTLWSRLAQHKGSTKSGGGNHRGSIFRLIVGDALLARQGEPLATWGVGSNAPAAVKAHECVLEREVSSVIGEMPFVCLPVLDAPGPQSLRGVIERNVIALLNNADHEPVDPPSPTWLGLSCRRGLSRRAGMWNSEHVGAAFEPSSLDIMAALVAEARRGV